MGTRCFPPTGQARGKVAKKVKKVLDLPRRFLYYGMVRCPGAQRDDAGDCGVIR